MRSKVLLSAAIIVAAIGMALPAGAATPINGTGKFTCTIAGTIKFKPPLKNGSTAPSKVTIKAKLTACGSGTGDGAHVASGTVVGGYTTPTSDCSGLAGTSTVNLVATAKWKVTKGSNPLNPSSIQYTSVSGGATATNATFDATGTVTGGSFNGDTATAHAVIQESLATLAGDCGGKGIKTLHIQAAGSTNKLS